MGSRRSAYLTQANGYFRRLEHKTLDKVPADARVRILFDYQENRDRFQRIRRLQQRYGVFRRTDSDRLPDQSTNCYSGNLR